MKSLGNFLVDLMAQAETRSVAITEIKLTEAQLDALSTEYDCCYRFATASSFNGARIVVAPKPLTPEQRTAAALRKLADELENTK